jgi:uncharacterized protein (DUF433 family)
MIGQQFLVLEVQFLNPATRRPPRRSPNQTSEQFIARDAQRRDLREDLANSPPVHIAPSPLRLAEGGVWRVGNSRISLDLIVEQYENGMTPEEIVRAYDTLGLADVHATIDYYRRYPDEGDEKRKPRHYEPRSRPSAPVSHGRSFWRAGVPGSQAMLRLASDADVNGHIIDGLRRHLPEIDLARAQDCPETHTTSRFWPGPPRSSESLLPTTGTLWLVSLISESHQERQYLASSRQPISNPSGRPLRISCSSRSTCLQKRSGIK